MGIEGALGEIPYELLDPIQLKYVPLPPITCWIIMIPRFNKGANDLDVNRSLFLFILYFFVLAVHFNEGSGDLTFFKDHNR